MSKQLFLTLFLCAFSVALFAQTHILLPDAPDSKCNNVSIGKSTLIAVYPEIEFTISFRDMKVYVAEEGKTQVYDAVVSQVTNGIYRAEINPHTWVEINGNTGTAVVYQHCFTRVFTPAVNLYTEVQARG